MATKGNQETGRKRPLDVERLVQIHKDLRREYDEAPFYSVWVFGGMHVEACALHQIAPSVQWEWSLRECDDKPHRATAEVDGAPFFALFTDEEKRAVIDGE